MPFKNVFFLIGAFAIIILSCRKEYSYEGGVSPFAEGTLKDSSGSCWYNSVFGTFYKGIMPDADSDFIELGLIITKPGIYSISTDAHDGFYFADSGYLYNNGYTIIHLKPVGTPVDTGIISFNVRFANDVCDFSVHVADSIIIPDTLPDKPIYFWQFTDSTNHLNFSGPSTGNFDITGLTGNLFLHGTETTDNSDTTLSIYLELPDTSLTNIVPSDYITTSNNSFRLIKTVNGTISDIYRADATTSEKITVRLIDYSDRVLSGWFFGTARDANGNSVKIETGSFRSLIK